MPQACIKGATSTDLLMASICSWFFLCPPFGCIFSSPHISQVEQHVSQHVQRFSQVNGVYQGIAGSVFLFKAIKVVTADFKGSYAPGRILNPDSA